MICEKGVEHHVTMDLWKIGYLLKEAFGGYLGWEVYHHKG